MNLSFIKFSLIYVNNKNIISPISLWKKKDEILISLEEFRTFRTFTPPVALTLLIPNQPINDMFSEYQYL